MNEVVAKNYLCLAALLEMVIANISDKKAIVYENLQIEIASCLGVVLPHDSEIELKNAIYSDDPNKWGIQIHPDAIEKCLNKYVNVSVRYVNYSHYDEMTFGDSLDLLLKQNNWVICCYSYGELNRKNDLLEVGHVGLITKIERTGMITMYDPGPKQPGFKSVRDDDLLYAIKRRNGGVLVIEVLDKDSRNK